MHLMSRLMAGKGAFPEGYYFHALDPYLWQWGDGWGIRYYGLAYVLGFLAVYAGLRILWRGLPAPWNGALAADLIMWLVAGVFLGARIGYSLVYAWPETLRAPWSIVMIWQGGMSSHGGFVGVMVALVWFSRRRKLNPWRLSDDVVTLAPAGIFFGRVANFINGELWGRPSTVPWAVIFPEAPRVDGVMAPRHPSQLYEALTEGLLLGVLLLVLRHIRPDRRPGWITACFLWGYAVARIVCEYFREPDVQWGRIGGWTIGQWLSLLVLAGGFVVRALSRAAGRSEEAARI